MNNQEVLAIAKKIFPPIPLELTQYQPAPPGTKPGQDKIITIGKKGYTGTQLFGQAFQSTFTPGAKSLIENAGELEDPIHAIEAIFESVQAGAEVINNAQEFHQYDLLLLKANQEFIDKATQWAKSAQQAVSNYLNSSQDRYEWHPELLDTKTGKRGVNLLIKGNNSSLNIPELSKGLSELIQKTYTTLVYNFQSSAGHRLSEVSGPY